MKLARKALIIPLLVFPIFIAAAQQREPLDTAAISKVKREATQHSQVMEVLQHITDVYGPRLTNSPGFKKAADYATRTMKNWGLQNVHYDVWDEPFGRGWALKKFSLHVVEPHAYPVIAYPKAWSPGVEGTVRGQAVYLDIKREDDLKKFSGKLKGKLVLFSLPVPIKPGYTPEATRLTDSALLVLANAPAGDVYQGRRFPTGTEPQRLAWAKWEFCRKEGAAAILEASLGSRSKDGTVMVGGATVPYPPELPYRKQLPAYHEKAPVLLPQIVVAAEHYNRMIRQIESGLDVTLDLVLETEFFPEEPGFNIIAEIPGTDLKDEVVMIGAHFDSWHSGTGTTDNGVGAAVMMEAMRLIKSIGRSPRRTIRVALWGGEEQGLLGSRNYVRRNFGQRLDRAYPYDSIMLTRAGEKFSVYFNMDHGNGKYRGIYAQGNREAYPIFRSWLAPFSAMGASTITLKNTSGTDHLIFDALNLPGFQFIQDPIEYGSRTYHTNMDVFDKAVEADLIHNAIITASFAWHAANREALFPRR